MADLRQYISGGAFFPATPRPPEFISTNRGFTSPNPYDMLMFRSDSTTTPNGGGASSTSAAAGAHLISFEMDAGGGGGGGDGGTGRWPRQETLTLLEIRSRLNPKFKEANQKGPLWDEISRIMSEEHGYQRSGKKCREKFENLYKYYKKTKEGKAGRQDGKHYRFFRQLEALYGENSNSVASVSETQFLGGDFHYNFASNNVSLANNQEPYPGPKPSDTSLSNSCDAYATSSDDSDLNLEKKRRGKRSLKAKIRGFIDAQMSKVMEKQEAWMEKMMSIIEHKEQERMLREEQWRKQDSARIEREQKLWASERAWIEARDAALMEAFHRLTGNQNADCGNKAMNRNSLRCHDIWPESEIARLIQLRTAMEVKFQERGVSEEVLWEEIANKMACFGQERSGLMCREKWDSVSSYLLKCNKKRKENSRSSTYYQNHHCDQGGGVAYSSEQGIEPATIRLHDDDGNAPSNNNVMNESCFRYFFGDPYGRIMN
ncbi:Trihelix transcription factor PTL [Sesamum alatum]|uniref:Trihelix transcription factor PTL n=1 Tax=Sesamum alatum TaxID=300844 RepID=A0AAE1YMA1_9LAMI|nr:Trihelix transcription factor PTL [Sesamum alatum]